MFGEEHALEVLDSEIQQGEVEQPGEDNAAHAQGQKFQP